MGIFEDEVFKQILKTFKLEFLRKKGIFCWFIFFVQFGIRLVLIFIRYEIFTNINF